MSDLFETERQNLALWHECMAEMRELCLLQQTQLGYRTATRSKAGELQDAGDDFINVGTLPASPLAPCAEVFSHTLNVEQRISFCRGILQALSDKDAAAPPDAVLPSSPLVCFLDSFFSREALRRFEAVLPMARPLTAPTFTEVCEELANDHTDFALLPIEDSREGRFWHLFEEIERFELRICMTCEIPYPNEGRTVTVALLSRQTAPLPRLVGQNRMALTLFDETPYSLTDLLQAALLLGFTIKRIDSLPAPYGEDGVFYHPIFCSKQDNEALFELYLSIFHPRARITAKYRSLK